MVESEAESLREIVRLLEYLILTNGKMNGANKLTCALRAYNLIFAKYS